MKRVLILTAVWVAAFMLTVLWMKLTRIGPVVFVISERYGLGVHTGDVFGVLPLLTAAGLTWLTAKEDRKPNSDFM